MDAVRDEVLAGARPVLEGSAYAALFDRLEAIIQTKIKRELRPQERQDLHDMIRLVATLYCVFPKGLSKVQRLLDWVRRLDGSLAQVTGLP
jgi:hypothetical protein